MKFFICILIFSFAGIISAQELDKLNKKELRLLYHRENKKSDSLFIQIKKVTNLKEKLETNLSISKNKSDLKSDEIFSLKAQIDSLKNKSAEMKMKLKINEENSKALEKQISAQQQMIYALDSSLNDNNSEISIANSKKDFLENFYLNKLSFNNGNFKLKLARVIFHNLEVSGGYYDRHFENGRHHFTKIPESVSAPDLQFLKLKKGVELSRRVYIEDVLKKISIQEVQSSMPEIEVLKNKLFTITSADKINQESFLLSIERNEPNNNRKVIFLKLESDEGENTEEQDVVLPIFAVGQEVYLAISQGQCDRLKIPLLRNKLSVLSKGTLRNIDLNLDDDMHLRNSSYYGETTTSGHGYYLNRKKDYFQHSQKYIEFSPRFYLFKLLEL